MTINCNKPNLPILEENTIKLNTTNNKQISYTTRTAGCRRHPEFELSKLIAEGVMQYSTNSDPNISENELNSFKQYVYEGFIGLKDNGFDDAAIYIAKGYTFGSSLAVLKDAILNKFDRLYEIYVNDNKITPQEYTDMMKLILDSAENGKNLIKETINKNQNTSK